MLARWLAAATALVIAVLAVGCSSLPVPPGFATSALGERKPAPVPERRHARIAMLLPLSGMDASAPIAKAIKQAGEMALFDLNNPMVQLLVKDDLGTPNGARLAAQEAIRDGAEIILGPLHARAVTGAAPIARAANVPMISFSNDKRASGQGVYLMSFMAEDEVDRIVSFAISRGKRRFAALVPADNYGAIIEPAFREAVQKHGGSLAILATFQPKPNAMVEPTKRVVEAIRSGDSSGQPVDALFLPAGPEFLPHLGPLLTYSGFDKSRVQLLGTGAWDYPSLGREQMFTGGWFAAPEPQGFRSFAERFARTFGASPPRAATLGYDAAAIAISLAANPPGQRYSQGNLTRISGFNGTDGLVRFSALGTPKRNLAVLEVRSLGAGIVDPAPATQPVPQASWSSNVSIQ